MMMRTTPMAAAILELLDPPVDRYRRAIEAVVRAKKRRESGTETWTEAHFAELVGAIGVLQIVRLVGLHGEDLL